MTKPPEKTKPRLGARKYLYAQFALDFAGVIFVAWLMSFMVFIFFGNGAGSLLEVQVFVFLLILCFTVIQCWAAVTNTRQDLLRGKWFCEREPGENARNDYCPNPWRLVLPGALGAGFALAAAAAALMPRLGPGPFHPVNAMFLAGVPLFAASSILILILLPRDQKACAAALERKSFPAVSARRYLILEHILPWLPIQGVLNLAFGLKQFRHEAAKTGGDIPILTVALDAGFVFALIVFFMWMSSQVQVRPDVRLGRVARDQNKAPSVPAMFALFALCGGFGAVAWVILRLGFGQEISPLPAACFKAAAVMAAVVPGCALGVWWGRRRESNIE